MIRPADLTTAMIIMRICNETDLPESDVRKIILCLADEMRAALLRREPVTLDGIGTCYISDVLHIVTLNRDPEPRVCNCPNHPFTYRPFKPPHNHRRIVAHVRFAPDPSIKISVGKIANPTGERPPYKSQLFSQEECAEIKRQIESGEATIKGLARALNVDREVIRSILRGPHRRRSLPRYRYPIHKPTTKGEG